MSTIQAEAVPKAGQGEALSLSFLGMAVALAFAVLVVANGALFLFYYGDTFTPLVLPYRENFENTQRLDYRQFGGQWRLRDNTLVQSDTQDTDLLAVIPLTIAPDQPYQFGVRMTMLQGPKGGGLMFNLQHPNSRQQSHLVRFGSGEGKEYLVFGYFDENMQFVAQGSLPPPDISQGAELAVAVHDQTYDVLVNGQLQQRDIPLKYTGGTIALTTWFSSVAFDDVYITALAAAPTPTIGTTDNPPNTGLAPDAAVPTVVVNTPPAAAAVAENQFFTEQFPGNVDQTLWTPLTGDWRFEDGALVQQNPDGYDYSISRVGLFARFALSVHFRHRQGVGGGLLFNMPNGDTKRNGHLVRYFEDNSLAWGYFDNENVFTGQGYAPVEPPGDQIHTLKVIVGDTAYSILLDNRVVTENVPLVSTQGHIGLTASQSVVAFEEILITELQ